MILDAAAQLLRSRSYEGLTVRALADSVGIKSGSIYHHFASKDEIVGEVVVEGVRVVLEAVQAALAALPLDATPRQRLEVAVKHHLLSSLEHSNYTSASIRSFAYLPPTVQATCKLARRRYEDLWRALIQSALDGGLLAPGVSPESVRLLLLGAVNWAGEWYRQDKMDIDTIAHDFVASVMH